MLRTEGDDVRTLCPTTERFARLDVERDGTVWLMVGKREGEAIRLASLPLGEVELEALAEDFQWAVSRARERRATSR